MARGVVGAQGKTAELIRMVWWGSEHDHGGRRVPRCLGSWGKDVCSLLDRDMVSGLVCLKIILVYAHCGTRPVVVVLVTHSVEGEGSRVRERVDSHAKVYAGWLFLEVKFEGQCVDCTYYRGLSVTLVRGRSRDPPHSFSVLRIWGKGRLGSSRKRGEGTFLRPPLHSGSPVTSSVVYQIVPSAIRGHHHLLSIPARLKLSRSAAAGRSST